MTQNYQQIPSWMAGVYHHQFPQETFAAWLKEAPRSFRTRLTQAYQNNDVPQFMETTKAIASYARFAALGDVITKPQAQAVLEGDLENLQRGRFSRANVATLADLRSFNENRE